ncbi:hypothetical protein BVF91_10615 [Thermoanaerobacterium sp. PSU-2]|uniref:hypothetical protein n=1 Tax=Thermoanaerobacterium sp. PSU-2 TaxID=1930849 RepID=UPI000A1483B5|nr:hypothetical protein [Thermoanaerobacterium sp. PSU-2]ORX22574.1 hypothetical protein BVF91_10615 [Thermoanaerobacterium sp. PSU-2]
MPPKKGTPEYEAWRNSPQYEEYRQRMRQRRRDPEFQEKLRQAMQSEEFRAKMSQAAKRQWQDEALREKLRQEMLTSERYRQSRQFMQSEEYREKLRQAMLQSEKYRQAMQSEEYRKKKSQAMLQSESFQQMMKERWQDEAFREKMHQVRQSEEFREKLRQALQELWQDPDYARKALTQHLRQTRPEKLIEQRLNELFPGEYKYVGDGQLIIGGKCPDFANVNGKKKLIEVFGDYWHEGQDPQERIEFFRQYGFDCLVIWESELEDITTVVEKLVEFHRV